MDRKVLLGLVALAAVGGVGYYVYSSNGNDVGFSVTDFGKKTYDTKEELEKLAASGDSFKCEFDDENVRGVIYVDSKDERARMDVKEYKITPVPEDEMGMQGMEPSHMISTKEYVYMWGDNSDEGMKVPVMDDEQSDDGDFLSDILDEAKDAEDGSDLHGMKCVKWRVDDKVFNPPSDVKFTDFWSDYNEQMEKMKEQVKKEAMESEEITDEEMKQLEDMLNDLQMGQ